MAVLQIIPFLLAVWSTAHGAKILVMVTASSPSLFNLYSPIIEGLSSRKHDVTVQSFYPLKQPIPNVIEMIIAEPQLGGDEEFTKNLLLGARASGAIVEVYNYAPAFAHMCDDYLKDKTTATLVAGGKQFDLVLADGLAECSLVVASMVGKHIATLLGSGNFPWLYSDAPTPPSYVPNYFHRITSEMTFWQRMVNAIDIGAFRLLNDFWMTPENQKLVSKHLPQAPRIRDVLNQVTFTITNGDPVLYSPRPTTPNVIDCGGLHTRDPKPLPKELNDFVQSSGDDGFIILGLGTIMKSKFLPAEVRDAMLTAFSRLKQKVIWKFEVQLENIPKNVKITNWLPQQDLLGHPKCRLFITHAGLLSLQEAVYHGVPVIGLPFNVDQPGNIGRVQELGMGEYLDFFNVTAEGFYQLIRKMLYDERYRNNAKKYSAIFKDHPEKPINRAIYWLEYILRHDGAEHLRPAGRNLNFFQYFLLDVVAFLLLIAVMIIGVIVLTLNLVVKKLFRKKPSAKEREKKRK